jgi:predicted ATPase
VARPVLRRLLLENVLSFGGGVELELDALNVLVGPNGSGKTNLLDVLGLLRACPTDIERYMRQTGGIQEWVHKDYAPEELAITAVVGLPEGGEVAHRLEVGVDGVRAIVDFERVYPADAVNPGEDFFYMLTTHGPIVRGAGVEYQLGRKQLDKHRSVLAQIRDPNRYPELTALGAAYEDMRIYRGWTFGLACALRGPQRPDLDSKDIQEDFANLVLVLSRLAQHTKMKQELVKYLGRLSDAYVDFDARVVAGCVELVLHERASSSEGDRRWTVPASRLSDGTLRYLALLGVLLDPKPPRVVCIEEPELGLHPNLLGSVAELLRQASARTQLFVTTHSDLLVEALGDREPLYFFDKVAGSTRVSRLDTLAARAALKSFSPRFGVEPKIASMRASRRPR